MTRQDEADALGRVALTIHKLLKRINESEHALAELSAELESFAPALRQIDYRLARLGADRGGRTASDHADAGKLGLIEGAEVRNLNQRARLDQALAEAKAAQPSARDRLLCHVADRVSTWEVEPSWYAAHPELLKPRTLQVLARWGEPLA